MSLGRKPKKVKTPAIAAPPAISQIRFDAPTGDTFGTRQDKGTQISESILSPATRQTVGESQQALSSLAEELNNPDAARMEDIHQRARDFYDLQAEGINRHTDDVLGRTASGLSKRFGGTYNATFGTDLLSRLEKNRADQLSGARVQAGLYGEDLARQDEASRVQRFQLFQNYLSDLNSQARSFTSQDAGVLQSERNRAQSLAVARAQMLQSADIANQNAMLMYAGQRNQAIMDYAGFGLQAASKAFPASSLGGSLLSWLK